MDTELISYFFWDLSQYLLKYLTKVNIETINFFHYLKIVAIQIRIYKERTSPAHKEVRNPVISMTYKDWILHFVQNDFSFIIILFRKPQYNAKANLLPMIGKTDG